MPRPMPFKEGNKAINLKRLREAGFQVPSFIIVPPGISEPELIRLVNKEMPRTKVFAVRSSSPVEDTRQDSKAGKYYSAIGVREKDLFTEYNSVLGSYGEQKSGVIVQKFIPSRKAGILFTDNGSGKVILNGNFGLCKFVVEGRSCDEYILDSEGRIIKKFIPEVKESLHFRNNRLEVSETRKGSLKKKEIMELLAIGKQIEKIFKGPQDIEWCYYHKRLILLQTRFITRSVPDTRELIHYDSANIAESYSGIVLPLTLSFARHIYRVVYENLLHASGVPRKKLRKHQDVFNNMVSWFYGRLYYNMNNWYRMMAFIPGYQRNKTNLENMITSNIRLNIERNILPGLTFKFLYPLIVLIKLIWFIPSQNIFERRIRNFLAKYKQLNFFDSLTFGKCRVLFREFDRELISKWHVPVENDFLVMTFFGLLQKYMKPEKLQGAVRFTSKTGQQIEALIHIKDLVYDDDPLRLAVEESNVGKFRTLLAENKPVLDALATYYSEYGGRFANELKLESPDVEEDFGKLISLLRLYRKMGSKASVIHEDVGINSLFLRILIRRFRKYAAQRESMRLLRSNGFSVVRKLFKRIGAIYYNEKRIAAAEDIFFLSYKEIFAHRADYTRIVAYRKEKYLRYETLTPPVFFTLAQGELPPTIDFQPEHGDILQGRPCNNGFVRGRVRVFQEFKLPDVIDFDILVARNTDPGWTPLLGLVHGLIIENGGILSHAAIVSRELDIPTVIGAENATIVLRSGMEVELNGSAGLIRIIHEDQNR